MVLPVEWRGQRAVREWQAVVSVPWLRQLWASIDRTASFGGPAADEMRSRLDAWPVIPCGEQLVQLSRAATILFDVSAVDRSAGAGSEAAVKRDARGRRVAPTPTQPAAGGAEPVAYGALRALGIPVANDTFELKAIADQLAPLSGSGVLSALTALAAESGGLAAVDWSVNPPSERRCPHEWRRVTVVPSCLPRAEPAHAYVCTGRRSPPPRDARRSSI